MSTILPSIPERGFERNQCDGCNQGAPLNEFNNHVDEKLAPFMACQRTKYDSDASSAMQNHVITLGVRSSSRDGAQWVADAIRGAIKAVQQRDEANGAAETLQPAGIFVGDAVPTAAFPPAPADEMDASDRESVLWAIRTLRAVADLGRAKPLGDWWPQIVQTISALKSVLRDAPDAIDAGRPGKGLAPGHVKPDELPLPAPAGWVQRRDWERAHATQLAFAGYRVNRSGDGVRLFTEADVREAQGQAYALGRGDAVRDYVDTGDRACAAGDLPEGRQDMSLERALALARDEIPSGLAVELKILSDRVKVTWYDAHAWPTSVAEEGTVAERMTTAIDAAREWASHRSGALPVASAAIPGQASQ